MYFCIGDVSGKGIPAAMVMARCSTLFRAFVSDAENVAPEQCLNFLNGQLCTRNEELMFVTMWVGELDLCSGHLRYASAGHNPPVLVQEGSAAFIEKKQCPPLGMFDDSNYEHLEMNLSPGQALLLYTDGITEAEGPGTELFGDDRLLDACLSAGSICPELLCRSVLDAVKSHSAGLSQSDDITLLSISYGGKCAQLGSIDDLDELHSLAAECGCDNADNAALALEEAAVNAFTHGHATFVSIEYQNGVFTMFNDGDHFDPTAYKADISDDLAIGGRGISLIRQLCSEFAYQRTSEGLNRLRFTGPFDFGKQFA